MADPGNSTRDIKPPARLGTISDDLALSIAGCPVSSLTKCQVASILFAQLNCWNVEQVVAWLDETGFFEEFTLHAPNVRAIFMAQQVSGYVLLHAAHDSGWLEPFWYPGPSAKLARIVRKIYDDAELQVPLDTGRAYSQLLWGLRGGPGGD
ncbi:hypothetical protein C7212DRAFT_335530, partial [Tuber magnatum]